MHLIIPYAASGSPGFTQALPELQLPNLQKLLARLRPLPVDAGDAYSLTPPHERALARSLGLDAATDGRLPWAALHARQQHQLDGHTSGWAFISLCHWQVNTNHIAMSPLPALTLPESEALLAAMQPFFAEDGITLHPDQPGRWLAQAEVFAELASACTDRVVGRNLASWLPEGPLAAPLRRLQNEMQMLLYTHPVNDAREAQGLTPVNSFWLSGTGALPAGYQPPDDTALPEVEDRLKPLALTENWPAWVQAWQHIDATRLPELLAAASRGKPVQLTLCGERSSQCWQVQPQPVWHKLKGLFGAQPLSELLGQL